MRSINIFWTNIKQTLPKDNSEKCTSLGKRKKLMSISTCCRKAFTYILANIPHSSMKYDYYERYFTE